MMGVNPQRKRKRRRTLPRAYWLGFAILAAATSLVYYRFATIRDREPVANTPAPAYGLMVAARQGLPPVYTYPVIRDGVSSVGARNAALEADPIARRESTKPMEPLERDLSPFDLPVFSHTRLAFDIFPPSIAWNDSRDGAGALQWVLPVPSAALNNRSFGRGGNAPLAPPFQPPTGPVIETSQAMYWSAYPSGPRPWQFGGGANSEPASTNGEELPSPRIDPPIDGGLVTIREAWSKTFFDDQTTTSSGPSPWPAPFSTPFPAPQSTHNVPEPFAGGLFCTGLLGIWRMKRRGRGKV